jgi:hypothetical protein
VELLRLSFRLESEEFRDCWFARADETAGLLAPMKERAGEGRIQMFLSKDIGARA